MTPMSVVRAVAKIATAAGATAVLAVLGLPATAQGAPAPTPATLSSVHVVDHTVEGTVTVRAAADSAKIDSGSLRATVGGKSCPVTVKPQKDVTRATMLVVDTSGSMGAAGMSTVRTATASFLQEAPADVRVGLISFAGTAGVDVTPTLDRNRIQKAVNTLVSRGETTLYDAVALATTALAQYEDRSIILLSDGGDTASAKATKQSATAALKTLRVRAEVIGFKTAESDNKTLAGFAAAGGGSVAAAGDSNAVRSAFEAAARALDDQVAFTIDTPADVRSAQALVLTGTSNGRPFRVQASVDFGAGAVPSTPAPSPSATPTPDDQASAPAGATPERGGLPTQLLVALGLTFFGLLALGIALVAPMFRSSRSKRVETIEQYVNGAASAVTAKASSASPAAISSGLVNIGDRVMEGRESTSKTMALITRADLALRPGEWWVLRLVSIVVGIAVAMLFFRGGVGMTIFALLAGAVLGLVLPSVALRFLARRRGKKFEAQLPEVLTLVASSLSTGFSLLQALDAVAKDAAEPSAKEFSRALAETRIGADVGEALEHMADRMDSVNMRWTAMAIRIQREVGGNLAETLRTTAKTLREREELKRHVRALSAEGRLSAYILIALPIGIFLYTMQTNREYIELLWQRQLGWAMLAGGIVSLVIGVFWMRKVVDVKV